MSTVLSLYDIRWSVPPSQAGLHQLCRSAAGTLDRGLCSTATTPLGGWPQPSVEAERVLDRLSPDRRRLLFAHDLLVARVAVHRLGLHEPTFRWLRHPPDLVPGDAAWYIDGSLHDGRRAFAASTGFAVVVVGGGGDLLAFGQGVPPCWIRTAGGAGRGHGRSSRFCT